MKKYTFILLTLLAGCNSGEEITTRKVMEPAVVIEYTPAPGQFINDPSALGGFNGESTMEEAVAYASERLTKPGRYDYFVSLGGWGGYIVAKFDKPMPTGGDYEIYVYGNAFANSSEPGVVWVMQDTNGNGEPDDTWYELQGSEYDKSDRQYSITYYPPAPAGGDIHWEDSDGQTGTIDRNSHHTQASYFPAWLGTDPLVFSGTRLPDNIAEGTAEGSEAYISTPFAWGYADNYSSLDRQGMLNKFRISNAVTAAGSPANLAQIDFIKIQTGVNAKGPEIGEISTDVCGIGCYRTTTSVE